MKYLRNSKFFYFLVIAIAIGVLIAVFNSVSFVFDPIRAMFNSILTPIIIAIFVFYIFLPVYHGLQKFIKNDNWALVALIVVMILSVYILIAGIVPSLIDQTRSFLTMLPSLVEQILNFVENLLIEYEISSSQIYTFLDQLGISISNITSNVLANITSSLGSIISGTISFLIVLFTFPLILIYLYKDGDKVKGNIMKFVPVDYKAVTSDVLNTIHFSASQYIGGRILIVLFVAVLSYIAFLILGLPNALFLGIFCGILDIIPYFGPWIGGAPAFFVALFESPWKALLVVLFLFIIQQLESYVATPFVMGRNLDMHPVTVVLLVLFASEMYGIVGMIVILPIFSILKNAVIIIVDHILRSKGKKGIKTDHLLSEAESE